MGKAVLKRLYVIQQHSQMCSKLDDLQFIPPICISCVCHVLFCPICDSFSATPSKCKDTDSKFPDNNELCCSNPATRSSNRMFVSTASSFDLCADALSPWQKKKMKMVVKNGCCHNFCSQSRHSPSMLCMHMSY